VSGVDVESGREGRVHEEGKQRDARTGTHKALRMKRDMEGMKR